MTGEFWTNQRYDDLKFNEEVKQLHSDLADAVEDGTADFGEEVIEAGGYFDLAEGVALCSDVSRAAKMEFARQIGIDHRLARFFAQEA